MLNKKIKDDVTCLKSDVSHINRDITNMDHHVLRMHNEITELRDTFLKLYITAEKGLVEDKDLVIIHDNGETRIYEHGEDITAGITEITFRPDSLPVIEYEKVVK